MASVNLVSHLRINDREAENDPIGRRRAQGARRIGNTRPKFPAKLVLTVCGLFLLTGRRLYLPSPAYILHLSRIDRETEKKHVNATATAPVAFSFLGARPYR